jgi:two-component system, cell cycle sensor histidine kinase and response regulator CckA
MTNTPLHVLYVEDEPDAVQMLAHELQSSGFAPSGERVDSREEFLAHLDPKPDLILSDFTMPGFNGLQALRLMKERKIDLPFIFVSGTIGEDNAVVAMQEGAADFLIKDRLARLGPAVKQALTQWRLKQEKLAAEQTASRLAAIVEASGEAIIAETLDGVITNWNPAAERLYGYSAKEILGKHISVLIPRGRRQADAPEDQQDILKRLRNGETIDAFETVRVRKDGRRIEILSRNSPIRDARGFVTGASAIYHDITQRKRAERYLKAEGAVSRVLTESTSLEQAGPRVLQAITECLRWEVAVLWTVDQEANVLRRSYSWQSPWAEAGVVEALSRQTVLEPGLGIAGRAWTTGETVWEVGVSFDSRPTKTSTRPREGLRDGFALPMFQGREMVGVLEFYNPEIRKPDKALVATLDAVAGRILQFRERTRTEAALRASEEQYRQLADAMPQIVWTARPDGNIDYFNERWYQFVGRSRDEDPEQLWRSIVHPDDLQRGRDMWDHSTRTGAPFEMEIRFIERNTGRPRWFLFRANASMDAAGAVMRWYGTGTDIDDQKRSLEELRISEERFRNLVMALPAAVYTTDATGLITLFNEHAVELWGRRPELGKDRWCGSWKLLRSDGSPLPLDQCPMAVTLREGRGIRGEELIIERPDGSRAHVLPHPEPLHGAAGEIVGGVNMLVDFTQMKQLENQFRQSQKMEAVGQLAAGMAHDFNNLLTVILAYSEIFVSGLPVGDPGHEPMEQIRIAGERAATLTARLLAFGRKQILAPVVLDLNSLLTEIQKMLGRLIGADVELTTILHPELGCVKVDPGQIEQLIMNLAFNARDAMPTGGRLTIQTHNTTLSELQARQNPDLLPGPYAMVAVSDTGCGMDETTKAHIFEPFFTTKEVGKGTGLGLATVFGIIKQSGGFIEVDSTVGSGSAFRAYFPQIGEAIRHEDSPHDVAAMPRGWETILLVEDDDGVRELAKKVLEASGYNVLGARNGDEAIQVGQEYADAIQLLYTDLAMPKLNGRQLTDLLVQSRPSMKVLYCSGYTDDAMVRRRIGGAGTNFLSKPFTPAALAQKVREVLGETRWNTRTEAADASGEAVTP